jgi:hypothetical protein
LTPETPINAGTRFEKAADLVRLDPDDCIPVPAYKVYGARKHCSNLFYVVSVDYELVSRLDQLLTTVLTGEESIVWDLLNKYDGSLVRSAEDDFIFRTVRKYWAKLKEAIEDNPFNVISARKATRIRGDSDAAN